MSNEWAWGKFVAASRTATRTGAVVGVRLIAPRVVGVLHAESGTWGAAELDVFPYEVIYGRPDTVSRFVYRQASDRPNIPNDYSSRWASATERRRFAEVFFVTTEGILDD